MKRMNCVFPITVTLSLVSLGCTAEAAVSPAFFYSPAGQNIKQASIAADRCTLTLLKSLAAYESCVTAALDKNHGLGGDMRSFDAALFFNAWQQMDGIVRPLFPTKSEEDERRRADAKPLAVKYLKLYREAQKKAALTDEQVIVGTGLDLEVFKTKLAAADHGY